MWLFSSCETYSMKRHVWQRRGIMKIQFTMGMPCSPAGSDNGVWRVADTKA